MAVSRWYDGLAAPDAMQSARTDFYLQPADDNLGIKLREGRVEIKQRAGAAERVRIAPGVAGRVEPWRKWSFALATADAALVALAEAPEAWIAVHKQRVLKRYMVDDTGEVRPAVSADPAGCTVEVARIACHDVTWWSVGLESSGPADGRRAVLLAVARHILSSGDVPDLPESVSFGYARWLTHGVAASGPARE